MEWKAGKEYKKHILKTNCFLAQVEKRKRNHSKKTIVKKKQWYCKYNSLKFRNEKRLERFNLQVEKNNTNSEQVTATVMSGKKKKIDGK